MNSDNSPTPVELAVLAATINACANGLLSIDNALNQALEWHKLAQQKLWQLAHGIVETRPLETLIRKVENQPRLKFEPDNPTDEVRQFLREADPSKGAPLRNLHKANTVEDKLQRFFVDVALLNGNAEKDGETRFKAFRGDSANDTRGKPVYALPLSDLVRFRCWLRELARVEALLRKHRKNKKRPSALEIRVRLAVAASGNKIDRAVLQEEYATGPLAENRSKHIISKLQSLKHEKQRTRRRVRR